MKNTPINPNIEARVYKVSNNIYILRDKFPFEYLKPNDSFEANVVYHIGSSSKFEIETVCKNENGDEFNNRELRSI